MSDGKKTRTVADTNGPFASFLTSVDSSLFPIEDGVTLDDRGDVVFAANLDSGVVGIFTGPDVIKNR